MIEATLPSFVFWLLVVLAIAVAWWPLCGALFSRLPDSGLTLLPAFSALCTTLLIWCCCQQPIWSGEPASIWRALLLLLSCSLGLGLVLQRKTPLRFFPTAWAIVFVGGFIALLPANFTMIWCWILVIAVGVCSWGLGWNTERESLFPKRDVLLLGAGGLLLYMFGFLGFALIRSQLPEITFDPGRSGAEKFGNLMHLTSVLRSTTFPPQDAWAAGFATNYYYGTHLSVAIPSRMAGIHPAVAFNLGLCHTVGLILSSAYGLGLLLIRSFDPWCSRRRLIALSILMALGVGVFGNANAVFQALRQTVDRPTSSGVNVLPVVGAYAELLDSDESFPRIDYWQSSRAIHGAPDDSVDVGTITEFPAFSALLGDLHPHHVAQPYLILAIALALMLALGSGLNLGIESWHLLMLGTVVSALFFLNSWDFLFTMSLLLVLWVWRGIFPASTGFKGYELQGVSSRGERLMQSLSLGLSLMLPLVWILGLFLLHFEKPSTAPDAEATGILLLLQKIGFNLVSPEVRTRPLEFLIHFWPLCVPLFLRLRHWETWAHLGALCVALLLGNILLFLTVLFGGLFWRYFRTPCFPLFVMIYSTTLGVELLVLNDSYSGNYERYNTVFKFYYAAWPLVWAASIAPLVTSQRVTAIVMGGVILSVGALYPLLATISRLEGKQGQVSTLNGLKWMENKEMWKGDAEFAHWVWNTPLPEGVLLVESPSITAALSYSSDGRLASISGIPGFVGWSHHEAQWRGWGATVLDPFTGEERSLLDLLEERRQSVVQLYETGNVEVFRQRWMLQHQPLLIVVSQQEREARTLSPSLEELPVLHESPQLKVYLHAP
jgi:YYY domain-containing protein